MNAYPLLIIAIVFLYSFGHWIGGSVLVAYTVYSLIQDEKDPTGLERLMRSLRS